MDQTFGVVPSTVTHTGQRNITPHISNQTETDRSGLKSIDEIRSDQIFRNTSASSGHSLSLDDEVVCVVPVGQQVSGVIVIHTDVVVTEGPREEVVNLSGHVEDIVHPGGGGLGRRSLTKQPQNPKLSVHIGMRADTHTHTHHRMK